jgi:hypothetical protein
MSDPRLWNQDDWYEATSELTDGEMDQFSGSIDEIIEAASEGNFKMIIPPDYAPPFDPAFQDLLGDIDD